MNARSWVLGLLLLPAAAPHGAIAAAARGAEVRLTAQPGSALESTARTLMAHDIHAARHAGEAPLVLVGSARLGAGPAALFVQVQSASLCGSAGCSTSVYVKRGGGWAKVLDSVSGPIHVLPGTHRGMHDLLVHKKDRWVWNGTNYIDTLPVPPAY